ncbi:MAG: fibrobacter succinogenes major paralogous domain-containing protein [Bacteroidia bacterium]|nr:fibrobacter succinogenes major paralogous domain-containing protein [Bacteroidia bacterium]
MKRVVLFLTGFVVLVLQNQAQTVTDIDGNIYNTIIIGTQEWMQENLKVIHYRNGDAIPDVTGDTQWSNLSTGAYCNYNNNESNALIYGRLYNWYAVADSRNICPAGWHTPTDAEWTTLTDYLGGFNITN